MKVTDRNNMIKGITQVLQIQNNIILVQESIDQQIILTHHLIIMVLQMVIQIRIKMVTCTVATLDLQCIMMLNHIILLQLIQINKSARKYGKVHHIFDHSTDQKESTAL